MGTVKFKVARCFGAGKARPPRPSYELAFFLTATLQPRQILAPLSKHLPIMIRYELALPFEAFLFFPLQHVFATALNLPSTRS